MGPDPFNARCVGRKEREFTAPARIGNFAAMRKTIDTVILDLGGVLIDVDYEGTARAFAALGCHDFAALYSKAKQSDIFDRFETGALETAAFRDELRQYIDPSLHDEQIDHCWNAMLGSIPQERMELVARLRDRYKVLLLSNTNSLHVPAFLRIVREQNAIEDFRGLFDGAYFSNEMGMRKPDPAIFLHVLELHNSEPDRSLFIDDSPQHVQGAGKAGLNAEHLDLALEDIVGMVKRLGLLS